MATYSLLEAEASFSKLMDAAVAGEDVIVSRGGAPVVKIVALEKQKLQGPRVFGQKVFGDLVLTPGWEDDLPLDIWECLQEDGSE